MALLAIRFDKTIRSLSIFCKGRRYFLVRFRCKALRAGGQHKAQNSDKEAAVDTHGVLWRSLLLLKFT